MTSLPSVSRADPGTALMKKFQLREAKRADSPVPLNFSTQQRPRRDSSKASVRPAGRKRSPGARWREHVCWHVD